MTRLNGVIMEGCHKDITFQIFVSGGSSESVSAARAMFPAIELSQRGRTTLDIFAPNDKFATVPAFVLKDVSGGNIFKIIN